MFGLRKIISATWTLTLGPQERELAAHVNSISLIYKSHPTPRCTLVARVLIVSMLSCHMAAFPHVGEDVAQKEKQESFRV